jgi:hypothetical protein
MIAKLFRDGTVLAAPKTLRTRGSKFGFCLDWIMMIETAGTKSKTGFDHEETANPPSREDG